MLLEKVNTPYKNDPYMLFNIVLFVGVDSINLGGKELRKIHE